MRSNEDQKFPVQITATALRLKLFYALPPKILTYEGLDQMPQLQPKDSTNEAQG